MALKFRVKDEEENKSYQVEEIETSDDFEEAENFEEVHDDAEALTPDEIAALKKLASVADKLAALVADNDETLDEDGEEDPEPLADDGEEEVEEVEEEVVDTDEELPTHDSKKRARDSRKSFGAIERRNKVDDSVDTKQDSIAAAWAKRYGGKN